MQKKFLIVCLIIGLGITLFHSLRFLNSLITPEEQQGTGILNMREGKQVLTIKADRGDRRNSSNVVYSFTCDRESEKINCRLSRNNKHGRLRLFWHDSKGNRLLSLAYHEGRFNNVIFSFAPFAGKFIPGDIISIRVIEQWLSGSYKLEVSQ